MYTKSTPKYLRKKWKNITEKKCYKNEQEKLSIEACKYNLIIDWIHLLDLLSHISPIHLHWGGNGVKDWYGDLVRQSQLLTSVFGDFIQLFLANPTIAVFYITLSTTPLESYSIRFVHYNSQGSLIHTYRTLIYSVI